MSLDPCVVEAVVAFAFWQYFLASTLIALRRMRSLQQGCRYLGCGPALQRVECMRRCSGLRLLIFYAINSGVLHHMRSHKPCCRYLGCGPALQRVDCIWCRPEYRLLFL